MKMPGLKGKGKSARDDLGSGVTMPRQPMRLGVMQYAAIVFVIAAVVTTAAMYAALLGGLQQRGDAARRQAELTSHALAAGLSGRLDQAYARLQQVSRRPEVVSALSSSDERKMADAAQSALDVFPGALRTLLVPGDLREPDLSAKPPIGYALLDMIHKAAASGKPQPAEVHMLGEPEANVNLVAPVRTSDGKVLGALVVSYPPAWLADVLKVSLPDDARLQLVQQIPGNPQSTVVQRGRDGAGTQVRSTNIDHSRFALEYVAPAPPGTLAGLSPAAFGIILLVTLAALAVVVFGALALVRRAVKHDGGLLARVLLDLRDGGLQLEYPMHLPEMRPALGAALRAARDLGDMISGPAAAPARAATAEDEESPDILSGLEVHEEPPETMKDPEQQKRSSAAAAAPSPRPERAPEARLDPTILRAYDVRGVVGKTLSAEVARTLGRAIGSEAAARGVHELVVGRDGRMSSPELAEALIEGLVSTGRDVIDIGRVPTPVMYFSTYHLETGSGVEITGSHNPPDYNGFKIMLGGETLSGEAIRALGTRVEQGDLIDGEGSVRREDVLPDYIERIASDITMHRPLKVVVDCGNGVAGETAPQVLRSLGCEVEELFCEVDGHFPNHHPDPSDPENLAALISLVRMQEADIGLAFDGDGDRLGVVDSTGKIIWPDRQMMLYAKDILARSPGSDIIFDVKCSAHLAEVISDNAGVPVMWKTGHSLIKAKLKESGAPLAGEMSGHIFFNDRWDGFDDGIYTAARLLEILSLEDRTSQEVFAELPESVSTPEIKVDLKEGEPPEVIQALVRKAHFEEARTSTIDGLRVDFPDGWGLVRASNTTPCLVLRFEADSEEAIERIKAQFRDLLQAAKPGIKLSF